MTADATVDRTGRLAFLVKGEQGAGGGKTYRGQWQGAYDGKAFRSRGPGRLGATAHCQGLCRALSWAVMHDVTRILNAIDQGDQQAAEQLLPLVYDELRMLAAQKLAQEKPGQTLDATGLVHEAYLRMVGDQQFENRRHFFGAAAEAMRRILVDRARARQAAKRGGNGQRVDLELDHLMSRFSDDEIVEVHSLLDDLAKVDAGAARLTHLHVFGGLPLEEAGQALGISRATAYRNWAFARAWLRDAFSAAENDRDS